MQLSQHVQCQSKPSLLGLLICAGALYLKTECADMGQIDPTFLYTPQVTVYILPSS